MSRVLMIDNYDSFTYNLVQAFEVLGSDVDVVYNNELRPGELAEDAYTHVVVSPGPGRPEDAGVSVDAIRAYAGRLPILGVCLGHQAIAQAFGGRVGAAQSLMHGKPSDVYHDRRTIFAGLPSPMVAGRYHSLAVPEEGLPAGFEISAFTSDGEVMGIRHKALPVEGVQFHPESILTPLGSRIMSNFLTLKPVRQEVLA